MPFSGMHIGLVGPLPPPAGGMANQAQQLSESIEGGNGTVTFVRTNAPYRPEFIRSVKGLRAVFRLIPYLCQLWSTAGKVDVMHVLANSGWSWHLFAAPAVWIAWLRRTPVVVNYRGGEAETFFENSWHIVKPTLSKASSIVVPSGFLEQVFARRNVEVKVIPNILDLGRFGGNCYAKKTDEDRCQIVVTRNLEALYDVGTVIRAFAIIKNQLPDACLIVAGSGPEEAMLKALTSDLGLESSVTFTGRLSNSEIAELYKEADMMLNASLVDNSPNSLIEALASGVPVVSSNVGGIPYLVEHGVSGLLVEPKSPELLADAAIKVLLNEQLKASLIKQGKSVAQRFDKQKVLAMLALEYKDLIGQST